MKRWRHYKKEMAVVLAAFGSISEKDRYERFREFISTSFEGIPVYMAFSSRSVLKKLNSENIEYKNLTQTMADLDMEGYKRIVVSSVNIFPTDEHELNKKIVEGFSQFVPSYLKITGSLFSKTEHATQILSEINIKLREKYQDDMLLYVIHGAPYFEQAGLQSISYCKDFLTELHPHNFFTSLERIYLFKTMKDSLLAKFNKVKEHRKDAKIRIVPILLASGSHFKKDIAKMLDNLKDDYDISIVESLCGSENFNLLDIDFVREAFRKDIEIEIKKLG